MRPMFGEDSDAYRHLLPEERLASAPLTDVMILSALFQTLLASDPLSVSLEVSVLVAWLLRFLHYSPYLS
ncbi:hypothetical protein EDD85DRAFT_1016302 [Armillaria nabsnona]|nr:hypothetical protein EDD85DRAFT_1016302 [Armillaria nabsnona]